MFKINTCEQGLLNSSVFMKHIYLCLIDKTEIKQFDLKIPRSPYIQGSLVSVRAREDRDVIEFLWDIVFHNETHSDSSLSREFS